MGRRARAQRAASCGTKTLAALALSTACAAPRASEPAPLSISVEHYAGTVLSGPLAAAVPEEALADPWFIELRLAYLSEPPPGARAPLSAAAREVLVDGAPTLLATRGELARDVVSTSAPAEHARWQVRTLDALWPGTTLVRRARADAAAPDGPRARWRAFEIELARRLDAPASAEVALSFEGLVAQAAVEESDALALAEAAKAAEDAEPAPKPPALVREHIVLGATPGPGEVLRFFLPAPSPRLARGGYAVEVAIQPARESGATAEDRSAALERGRVALERSRERTEARSSVLSASEDFRFETAGALAALGGRGGGAGRRTALVFLADATGAEFCGELALLADEETLAEGLEALRARIDAAGAPAGDPAELGWFLESTALSWLAARASDPARALEPELDALLLRHEGQLGRYPDLVLESLRACNGLAEHRRRVEDENTIFLEDADPAARVRALDWLRARGLAPEGYDPLATPAERRAALARAEEAAAGGNAVEEGAQR